MSIPVSASCSAASRSLRSCATRPRNCAKHPGGPLPKKHTRLCSAMRSKRAAPRVDGPSPHLLGLRLRKRRLRSRAMILPCAGEMARLEGSPFHPLATVLLHRRGFGLSAPANGIITAFSRHHTQGMGVPRSSSLPASGEAPSSHRTGAWWRSRLMFYNYFTKGLANLSLELESAVLPVLSRPAPGHPTQSNFPTLWQWTFRR